ncbi:dephospho-CoA kinase [Fictibacillus gelatini]|uniref:dephospho-CoA kinase n=1 Tax=Fictibacillus gelatini TaxID=225985 RepID=UPI00047DB127|nr:dephospho-CoA kinase [Fictibacillus gelatini]
MVLIIGLTGGIASGKSTVSNIFKSYGIPVVDADVIARQVVEKGMPAYNEIVASFGKEILDENGDIHRKKLGSIVFHDDEKRMLLNSIVHPAVRQEMRRQADQFLAEGYETVVLDIPLLFESKLTHMVDVTLLIYVDEEVQYERLMARDQMTFEEAKARITSQIPLKEKRQLADAVIENNGTLEQLKEKVINQLHEWGVR